MRNKSVFGAVGLLILVVLSFYLFQNFTNKMATSNQKINSPEPISVGTVAQSPGSFKGTISISGTVAKIDQPNVSFTLGCGDACLSIPVIYNGKSPKVGASVIISGQIRDASRKYIFEGQDVK